MAVAVIGGLVTSTLLSLLVVPAVYTYVDDLEALLKRFFRASPEKPTVNRERRAQCSGVNRTGAAFGIFASIAALGLAFAAQSKCTARCEFTRTF